MQFEGRMDINLPATEVWTKLSDVRFLVTCLPNVHKVKEVEGDKAICIIRPGFSFARGTLELTIERLEMEPEKKLRFRMVSKGVGSSSEVESALTLEGQDGNTQVPWVAEVKKLTGLLKAVPHGLIGGAAQQVIAQVWDNVMEKLNAQGEKPEDDTNRHPPRK